MGDEIMDNVLVHQKNKIIELINSKQFSDAKAALTILGPLWAIYTYSYKAKELWERICQEEFPPFDNRSFVCNDCLVKMQRQITRGNKNV